MGPEFSVPLLLTKGAQGDGVEARSFEKLMYAPFWSPWDQRVAERETGVKAEQQ